MKKNLISAVMLLLGLTVASSCSNEEQLQQMVNDTNSIQAVIENVAEARTSVNENYQVLWTEGDAFDVWDGENYKGTLTLSSGVGTTSGSFNGAVDAVNGMTAFFPSYNGDSQTKAYLFAETYTSQETDAPMLGSYDGSKFTFNLLTSMLRVVVADVPAGEITMTITGVGEEKLTGEATLNENGVLNVPSAGNSVVSVNFTTTENGTLTFDVPIPVQNYTSGLNVVVKSGTTEFFNNTTNPINAVAGTLYRFDASYNEYALVKTADELTAAIAAGKTQIFLGADISSSEIIAINKSLTLNGNGYTLTSTAGRAINVTGADGVTIKNLTINASGERAINIIQNATNVTIDNVTATAANYTVNVASSAPSAKVDIKNSTLTGLCTVNVSAASANVKVDNSTINCNDNNTTAGEAYSALSLNKEAVSGTITATNSTIYVAEGSDSSKGRNGAENGEVTIDGSTADVVVMVAYITYPGYDYYHAFATFAKAVEFAKEGDVITLIRDIEISEPIVVEKGITIDLNGKTISQEFVQTAAYAMITNKGTLTIMDSSSDKTGKISYADVTEYSADNNHASNTISNHGTLTLKSGTIENVTSDDVMEYGYPHAIDAYPGSITNIEGGTVKSVNYDCIRMFCNSTTLPTTVNISGGKIINRVTFQNPSSSAAGYGVLNISGGEFTTTGKVNANVRLLNFSTDITKMEAEISGGTFDKGVKTQNYNSGASIALADWLTIKNITITEIQ